MTRPAPTPPVGPLSDERFAVLTKGLRKIWEGTRLESEKAQGEWLARLTHRQFWGVRDYLEAAPSPESAAKFLKEQLRLELDRSET